MTISQKDRVRFMSKVMTSDGCWEWLGYRNRDGYGRIKIARKIHNAQRVSWEIHKSEIHVGFHVLHHCDNPACVRPDHLFLGTNDDNVRDRISKGRDCRGEQYKRSSLTPEQIHEIRSQYRYRTPGLTTAALGKKYGVAPQTIFRILRRSTWKHLL